MELMKDVNILLSLSFLKNIFVFNAFDNLFSGLWRVFFSISCDFFVRVDFYIWETNVNEKESKPILSSSRFESLESSWLIILSESSGFIGSASIFWCCLFILFFVSSGLVVVGSGDRLSVIGEPIGKLETQINRSKNNTKELIIYSLMNEKIRLPYN